MLDIKNLTKEQAIEWHKKMWNFILENENKEGENLKINIKTRRELKETFLKENGFCIDDIKNECFICQYSYQQLRNERDINNSKEMNFCKYCPLDWCHECKKKYCEYSNIFQCECSMDIHSIHWSNSNPEEIINLPERML